MDAESLRTAMNAYVDSWEDFLMDRINTSQHTDALILLMKVVDDVLMDEEYPDTLWETQSPP